MINITPEQSRVARSMLGWTVNYITKIAGVGQSSFYAWENESRPLGWTPRRYLRATYESGGLRFDDDGAVRWGSEPVPYVPIPIERRVHP